MKPLAIYLIRHGKSEGNVDEDLYKTVPDHAMHLTPLGRQQAKEATEWLQKDTGNLANNIPPYYSTVPLSLTGSAVQIPRQALQIYCSPWTRTRETAAIINGAFKTDIKEDPRLREQSWGNYSNDELKEQIEKERKQFGTFWYQIPYGESGANVYDRQTMFIDTLYRDFEKPNFPWNVLITSHGLSIKSFLMRWYHWTPEYFDSLKNPRNCQIYKMALRSDNNKYDLITPMELREKGI